MAKEWINLRLVGNTISIQTRTTLVYLLSPQSGAQNAAITTRYLSSRITNLRKIGGKKGPKIHNIKIVLSGARNDKMKGIMKKER